MELYLVMTLVIFFGTAVLIMLSGMKKQLERKNDNS